MKKSHLVSLVVSVLASGLAFGASKTTSGDRPDSEYGQPIRISSSVLAFQQGVETRLPPKAGKYLSNGEWDDFAAEGDDRDGSIASGSNNGYLKFIGAIGTGHVYVPDESADRITHPHDGLLPVSQW